MKLDHVISSLTAQQSNGTPEGLRDVAAHLSNVVSRNDALESELESLRKQGVLSQELVDYVSGLVDVVATISKEFGAFKSIEFPSTDLAPITEEVAKLGRQLTKAPPPKAADYLFKINRSPGGAIRTVEATVVNN